jgi:hypothetical protein
MCACNSVRWGWIGCVRVRWRAHAAGSAQTRNPKPCEPFPSASTACGFGAQAFLSASAFSANIGAWNTACVTNLYQVCAAPGPAARTMAAALGRASVRRGPLCAAAPPMRRRVPTRAGTRLLGSLGVGSAARRGGSTHATRYICIRICKYIYTSVCVCVLHAYTYSIHSSVCVRTGRRYVCVHECAMGDGSAVCARVGGLGLKPEALSRASPWPSAWTAWWLRRAGVLRCVGVQREHRRVEHRACHLVVRGMRRSRPRRRARWRTRSAGLRCGAAGCVRRHRRWARARAHVQALACAGPWV